MAGLVATTQQTLEQTDNKTDAGGECFVLEVSGSLPINNTHDIGLVSSATVEMVNAILHGMVLPVCAMVCVPTNIINAIVFYKHGLRERINLCVFALSLVDLLYVLQAFCLFYGDRLYNYLTGGPSIGAVVMFFARLDYAFLAGLFYLGTVSWFISMLIASERCFCVLSPLTSKTVLKRKSCAAILLLPSAVILAGGLILGMRWDAGCVIMRHVSGGDGGSGVGRQNGSVDAAAGDNTSINVITYDLHLSPPTIFNTTTSNRATTTNTVHTTTMLISYPSQFYFEHTQLIEILDIFVYGMTIPVFCFTVVIASTIVTVIKLRNMAVWRGRSASSASTVARSDKENALTRMLVGTSVLFLVLAAPAIANRVVMVVIPDFNLAGRYVNLFLIMVDVSCACGYINASVNFFVYYSLGTRFRRSVNDLFGRIRYARHANTETETSVSFVRLSVKNIPSNATMTRYR